MTRVLLCLDLEMFATLGLFSSLPCPERSSCSRPNCLFSHSADIPPQRQLVLPKPTPAKPTPAEPKPTLVPAKRPTAPSTPPEPPRKLQKVAPPQRPLPVQSSSRSEVGLSLVLGSLLIVLQTGVPILKVNAAQSLVAIPVRQVCLMFVVPLLTLSDISCRRC